MRVEAASLGGKMAAVKVVFPWSTARREPRKAAAGAALFGPLANVVVTIIGATFMLIFAVRNLRLNRADRKGAFRVGMVMASIMFVIWIGTAHHVADPREYSLLLAAIGVSVYAGLAMCLLYLALEPAVRSRWPQALVTWNRLIAGRFGDAQVGAHVLTGAALGSALRALMSIRGVLEYRANGVPFGNDLDGSGGALEWFSFSAQTLQASLTSGLLVFFAIFGFRVLFRKDHWAAIATAIFLTLISNNGVSDETSSNVWVTRIILLVIFAVLTMVLTRMGLVSCAAALFFLNAPEHINLGPGLSGWYTPYGLATLALLMAIAVYAFWRSIGTRQIGDEQ